MPPIIATPPSFTRSWVLICFVEIGGAAPAVSGVPGSSLFTVISRNIFPSEIILGVTSSLREAVLKDVLETPAVATVWYGISVPSVIMACLLSRINNLGLLTTLLKPSACIAWSSILKSLVPLAKLNTTPPKPPLGRLLASDPSATALEIVPAEVGGVPKGPVIVAVSPAPGKLFRSK